MENLSINLYHCKKFIFECDDYIILIQKKDSFSRKENSKFTLNVYLPKTLVLLFGIFTFIIILKIMENFLLFSYKLFHNYLVSLVYQSLFQMVNTIVFLSLFICLFYLIASGVILFIHSLYNIKCYHLLL